MGQRVITFYWCCWCYPGQRLLTDGLWGLCWSVSTHTWSDDEAFLSFQGTWCSLLEEFRVVEELSSSVLLEGASNAWIWKFCKRYLASKNWVRYQLTGFSMPPFGWNTLSTVSPVILNKGMECWMTQPRTQIWLTWYCFCASLCCCCVGYWRPRSASWSRPFFHSAGCWWDCLWPPLWPSESPFSLVTWPRGWESLQTQS